MRLLGVVSSGLGRAHVFMSQNHYQNQFKLILGSGAWPGTLNVDLDAKSLEDYFGLRILSGLEEGEFYESIEFSKINGFERDGKSFGGATAFKGTISKQGGQEFECAVLIPDLTRHTSTAEVISKSFLREILPCEDGEIVEINLN